jgi:hypothetical protein
VSNIPIACRTIRERLASERRRVNDRGAPVHPRQGEAHMAEGTVASVWRYPVKSMMGEELNAALT